MGKYQPLSLCASVLSSLKRRAQLHSPWLFQPSFPCCCCPDFSFPLCLRILWVPAPGTAALGNLPKGLLLLLCPAPVLLDWAPLCHTGQAAVQGPGQAPAASCSPFQQISTGWCKIPSEMETAPKAAENWSLVCVDKSQSSLGLGQCIPLQIKP